MASKETIYEPLCRSSEGSGEALDHESLLNNYVASTKKQRWGRVVLGFFILVIVISNGIWLSVYRHQKSAHASDDFDILSPDNYHIMSPYVFDSEYVVGNMSSTNQMWRELFPRGGGAVKVDSQWAIDNKIQETQGYALDGKSIYVIAMYHQLHCLTVIRTSLYQSHHGRKQLAPWGHLVHCMDTMRQSVLCLADPTLGGVGAEHQCRDADALFKWTAEHKYTDHLDFDPALSLSGEDQKKETDIHLSGEYQD